jgi:putative phosphoesterase
MDRIAVIADVHGNRPALRAVLDDIRRAQATRVYCLGDLVGYFCMVDEVIEELRANQVISILGNHDYALAYQEGLITRSRSATLILKKQLETISAGSLAYLRTLPKTIEFRFAGRTFFGVHGGLDDTLDEYITQISVDYLERHAFAHDVLLSGQTHVPMHVELGARHYANPGSVGQPRDGDRRASYLLLDGDRFEFRRVDYAADELIERMRALDLPDELVGRLVSGLSG